MEPHQPRRVTDLLKFSDRGDIDEFVAALRKFESGEMSPDAFRSFRLARGTYGQRQMDVNMIRVKIPQGVLTPHGLEQLALVADKYSRGYGHVTTRQNVQLHMVKLDKAAEVMELLAEAGLTTREACGNTVRTVTASAHSGLHPDGLFDVTPYGLALTRHFLRNPICQALPRKFKIALSCCATDCAFGAIHDVGLTARTRVAADGSVEHGFRMAVGGGLSTSPEDAHLLAEFVPARHLLAYCEAVVRVFDAHGNRQNKARARLKYVIRKQGWDGFKALWQSALDGIVADGRLDNAIDVTPLPTAVPPASTAAEIAAAAAGPGTDPPALARFRATNVQRQTQPGHVMVAVRLDRGDITAAQLRALAGIAREFADGTVRATVDQNMLLRWVPEHRVAQLHAALSAVGLGEADAGRVADVTSCPGSDTCNLAVTGSRDLALALTRKLREAAGNGAASAVAAADSLVIKVSGCPNSCGQHHIAGIGFHGTVRRLGGKVLPEYQMHLGGGIDGNGATFGRHVVKVPARRAPEALLRLLQLYERERAAGEAPHLYFRRVSEELVKAAVKDLTDIDESNARPEDYIDLGAEQSFVVAIGEGECAT